VHAELAQRENSISERSQKASDNEKKSEREMAIEVPVVNT
jgi:hypothetical protein